MVAQEKICSECWLDLIGNEKTGITIFDVA